MLACVLALVALAGCSTLNATGDKGYVSGNGQVTEVPPAERGDPITLSGEGLEGEDLSLEALRGKVVVINVWGAWCTDCRKEAPELVAVADDMAGEDVAFLGIDARDPSRANARGYVRTFDVPFPSIYDPRGVTLLEFSGTITPNSIPSTIVLDREGRVAASILGALPSEGTLRAVIEKVVAEDG